MFLEKVNIMKIVIDFLAVFQNTMVPISSTFIRNITVTGDLHNKSHSTKSIKRQVMTGTETETHLFMMYDEFLSYKQIA